MLELGRDFVPDQRLELTLEMARAAKQQHVLNRPIASVLDHCRENNWQIPKISRLYRSFPQPKVVKVWHFLAAPRLKLVKSMPGFGPVSWGAMYVLLDLWPQPELLNSDLRRYFAVWPRILHRSRDWDSSGQYLGDKQHPYGHIVSQLFESIGLHGPSKIMFDARLQQALSIDVETYLEKHFAILPALGTSVADYTEPQLDFELANLQSEIEQEETKLLILRDEIVATRDRLIQLRQKHDALSAELKSR